MEPVKAIGEPQLIYMLILVILGLLGGGFGISEVSQRRRYRMLNEKIDSSGTETNVAEATQQLLQKLLDVHDGKIHEMTGKVSSLTTMTGVHNEEINKLRDTSHKLANIVHVQQGTLEAVNKNIDVLIDTAQDNCKTVWAHMDKQAEKLENLRVTIAEKHARG